MNTKDNRSRVPHCTYSDELSAQWRQLETDELLIRFAESRSRLADDPHRPAYHFVSPESMMNDPNGLCHWQGRWHLFYQGYPPEDNRQHWGHAVSDDLIRWKDLPYAIYPDPERCCYSGATYVEDDRVLAMYHGTEVGNIVAISSDPLLLNWEKLTGNAVIPLIEPDEFGRPYQVFDACIWKEGEHYYSLSGGYVDGRFQIDGRRTDHLFRSKNLVAWTYMGEFIENLRFIEAGDDGACPYFWPIGNKHILLTFSHRRAAQYVIGSYDTKRQRLIAETYGNFNTGSVGNGSIHAPSACPDGEGGVVCIYNVNEGKSAKGWNQVMSLPRRYTLSLEGELLVQPIDAVESLRVNPIAMEDIRLPANEEVVFDGISGTSLEVRAVLEPGPSKLIDLRVFRSPNLAEYTSVRLHRETGLRSGGSALRNSLIVIDTSSSSTASDVFFRGTETTEICLEPDEAADIRVFLDRSIVEVFVNGKQAILQRVYPHKRESVGFSMISRGNDARCRSLTAWEMKSIYEKST